MCDHARKTAVRIGEDDAVRARALRAVKGGAVGHDGEFLVRAVDVEREVLVVLLVVRVVVAADGLAVLVEGAASGDGVVDVVNGIGVAATGGAVGLPGCGRGGGG
jgi:hypothetical protein